MKKVEAEGLNRKMPPIRGKYISLLRQGSNVAILDPDVVDHFPDSESVNNALRAFLEFGKHFESVVTTKRRPPKRMLEPGENLEFDPRTGRTDKVFAAK